MWWRRPGAVHPLRAQSISVGGIPSPPRTDSAIFNQPIEKPEIFIILQLERQPHPLFFYLRH
jgi:hypothetical protein